MKLRLIKRLSPFGLLMFSLMPTALQGQDWHWQNPLPQGNTLRSFCFVDQTTGWTVGNAGAILHTTDAGTWIPQTSGTTFNLRGVYFTDATTGWAVGNGGTVLHTSNAGDTWTIQTSSTIKTLYGITFATPDSGWAVGDDGTVIHTTTSGATWFSQTSGVTQNLHSLVFTDNNHGWAVGLIGAIIHTSNGGATWSNQTSGVNWDLYSVTFTDNSNGWAVGLSDTVLHTTDGGTNWEIQPTGSGQDLYSVTFTSPQTGWAAGLFGTIIHTTNGGMTWTTQTSGEAERLETVLFIDPLDGWTAGTGGVILHSSDGGLTWSPQTTGTTNAMLSVFFVDSLHGWAVGLSGTIRHTTDGGDLWGVQTGATAHSLRSVCFVDTNRGWLLGDLGTIEHTTNAGSTWVPQTSGVTQNLQKLSFVDANTGWAVGDGGVILQTTNGGMSWGPQTSGTTANLRALCYVDQTTLWAVGTNGTVLHTTNGGGTWETRTIGLSTNLLSVFFADLQTGWIGGESGTILHTTDGGTSWMIQTSGTTLPMSSISFSDPVRGLITGGAGKILETTDGGTNWIPQASNTTQWLFSSSFTDANKGWAVGQEGAIIHTATGGTGRTPPSPPLLLLPLNGSLASTSPTLSWSPAAGAQWYSVQLSKTSSFAVKLENVTSITGTSLTIPDLDEDSTYFWRVSVTTTTGTSGWSETRSFRTGLPPDQVALVSPENGSLITSDSVVATWHASRFEVDRYWVETATDPMFTVSEIDSTVADTSTIIRDLQHHQSYWWRIRAHNAVGWGEFSEVRGFFSYFIPLSPPQLVSPPDRAVDQPSAVPLIWRTSATGFADTILYHLQFSPNPIFDSLIVNDSTLTDTSYAVASLDDFTTYYWRVRARDSFSTSTWSDEWRFRTLPPLPSEVISLAPADGSTILVDSVHFLWRTAGPVVDRYWLEVSTDSLFSGAITDSSITDTTATVRSLLHHETYYWRVRAHNARGWGEPGPAWSFFVLVNTPSAPALLSPPDEATDLLLTVDFAWRAVSPESRRKHGSLGNRQRINDESWVQSSDSISYHFQLATDPGFSGLVENDSTLADTTVSVNALTQGTTYYWRVRARNLVGPGTWSDTWAFTTLALPGQVILSGPADGTVVADTGVTCYWFSGQRAIDAFWFEWADNPSFVSSHVDSTGVDTLSFASPLGNGQTYSWRVRAHNAIGWGEFSEVWTFTVVVTSVENEPELPTVFSLSQNYPNPFNPATVIRYGLPRQTHVLLEIFNMLGERVGVLVDEEQGAGYHATRLDARDLASGTYIYRLRADDFVETRKLLLIR